MTNTETTTHDEIGKKIETLKRYREYLSSIDHVLRWIDERKRGLASAKDVTVKVEFRRENISTKSKDYYQTVRLPESLYAMMLLVAKDHWASMIGPLEKWLDERKIEHVESAKAD